MEHAVVKQEPLDRLGETRKLSQDSYLDSTDNKPPKKMLGTESKNPQNVMDNNSVPSHAVVDVLSTDMTKREIDIDFDTADPTIIYGEIAVTTIKHEPREVVPQIDIQDSTGGCSVEDHVKADHVLFDIPYPVNLYENESLSQCSSSFVSQVDEGDSILGPHHTDNSQDLSPQILTNQIGESKKMFKKSCRSKCQFSCKTEFDRRQREKTHTGEKPYTCSACDKSFSRRHHIQRHQNACSKNGCYKYLLSPQTESSKGNFHKHKTTHIAKNVVPQVDESALIDDHHTESSQDISLQVLTKQTVGPKTIFSKPCRCAQCQFSCKSKFDLRQHMRTHTGEKPYKCSVCDKSFRRSDHLKRHQKMCSKDKSINKDKRPHAVPSLASFRKSITTQIAKNLVPQVDESAMILGLQHSENSQDISPQIGALFPGSQHTENSPQRLTKLTGSKTILSRPFCCTQCPVSCKTKFDLRRHERTHTGEKPYTCSVCDKSFRRSEHLQRHQKTCSEDKLHKCSPCLHATPSLASLRRHRTAHVAKNLVPPVDESAMILGPQIMNKQTSGSKTFNIHPCRCAQCPFSCKSMFDLRQHERSHTVEKQYTCSVCGYGFHRRDTLRRHQTTYSKDRQYKCSLCPHAASSLRSLRKHRTIHIVKNVVSQVNESASIVAPQHTESSLDISPQLVTKDTGGSKAMLSKPFSCAQCPIKCKSKFDLKQHERSHREEKAYTCLFCAYSSSRLEDVQTHQLSHTGERPFKCSQCLFSSSARKALEIHQQIHVDEDQPRNHKRTHTSEKMYQCSICPHICSTSAEAKIHVMTHACTQVYKCSFCSYISFYENNITVHERTHTV